VQRTVEQGEHLARTLEMMIGVADEDEIHAALGQVRVGLDVDKASVVREPLLARARAGAGAPTTAAAQRTSSAAASAPAIQARAQVAGTQRVRSRFSFTPAHSHRAS
jgi:hypothetical protein